MNLNKVHVTPKTTIIFIILVSCFFYQGVEV